MPNHVNQRIAFLRELVKAGFHQENLDKIVAECSSLAQDTSYVLTFFVLKHLFAEISAVLEGEAVNLERFKELTSEIGEAINVILDKAINNEKVSFEDLESFVRVQIHNLNVFRSDR
jgi:hypothetical protein